MEHPFFESIDWDKLANKNVQPPYIPKTKRIDDLRHIDPMFKDEIVEDTPTENKLNYSQKERNHFKEFTYSKEGQLTQNIELNSEDEELAQVIEEAEYEDRANSEDND